MWLSSRQPVIYLINFFLCIKCRVLKEIVVVVVVVVFLYTSMRVLGPLCRLHLMPGLHALSQVYILGYIARAVLYKVPDGSSSENGSVEVQGTLEHRFNEPLFNHEVLIIRNVTFRLSKSEVNGNEPRYSETSL